MARVRRGMDVCVQTWMELTVWDSYESIGVQGLLCLEEKAGEVLGGSLALWVGSWPFRPLHSLLV